MGASVGACRLDNSMPVFLCPEGCYADYCIQCSSVGESYRY